MKLRRLKVEKSKSSGGLFNGADIWLGRNEDNSNTGGFMPLCLLGANGSGKSQFLQLIAEIFQAAWHQHAPKEERLSANNDILFELDYVLRPKISEPAVNVRLVRKMKGRKPGPVELFINDAATPESPRSAEYGAHLPEIIVGYTSGDNETLSLPFLISRSGYANEVYSAAKKGNVGSSPRENRLALIDYGTNLEVLLANMLIGCSEKREELLKHAKVVDLASFRCVVRLKPSSGPVGGILLTSELKNIIARLKAASTCWDFDEKHLEHTFDFFVTNETRDVFTDFWKITFQLYIDLHKLSLLNDLAIPKKSRNRMKKAIKERRFASRLPEPQQEDVVFGVEEVRFWTGEEEADVVDYVSLSDGEHQQTLILGVYSMIEKHNAIFLLDEPESHFNPQWRTKFVKRLLATGAGREGQEMILSSHAPFVASDMSRSQVLVFDRCDDRIVAQSPIIETYGASYDRILEHCFKISPPISEIANDEIDQLLKSDEPDELEDAMVRLGDSVEKTFVAARLRLLRDKVQ